MRSTTISPDIFVALDENAVHLWMPKSITAVWLTIGCSDWKEKKKVCHDDKRNQAIYSYSGNDSHDAYLTRKKGMADSKSSSMSAKGETTEATISAKSYALHSVGEKFEVFDLQRRAPREDDVVIRILYCGICHSDIHKARNEWNNSKFPMVPGHEITGIVEKVGAKVTKVQVGDHVGVGCLVDSCRQCHACKKKRSVL